MRPSRYYKWVLILAVVLALVLGGQAMAGTASVTLTDGWNLIGGAPGTDYDDVLWGWDGTTYQSAIHPWAPQAWKGYWLDSDGVGSVDITTIAGPETVDLLVGWNLIANPMSCNAILTLDGPGTAFVWDGSIYVSLVSGGSLLPGQGAWVKGTATDQSTTLTPAVTVTSISPPFGDSDGGESVTITGTGFTGATAVNFGTMAVTVGAGDISGGGTVITLNTPAHGAGTVDVTVDTPLGTSEPGDNSEFTFWATPTITSIDPTDGPTAAGTSVTITGTGFNPLGFETSVTFDGVAAGITSVNAAGTEIVCTAPAGTDGDQVDVVVDSTGGTSGAAQYTYWGEPTVTQIDPDQGPATGGTTVTITGDNFSPDSTVLFGTIPAENVQVNSETEIDCDAPAITGTLAVAVGPTVVDVTVTAAGGTSDPAGPEDDYSYWDAPTITSMTRHLPLAGGLVTIVGQNFSPGTTVTLDGAPIAVTVVDTMRVTFTASAHAAGGVPVVVTSVGGIAPTQTLTYWAAPDITTINPTQGPLAAGTDVTITGTDFSPTGTTTVMFGANAATNVVVNAAGTQITCDAPAGAATGSVTVTVTSVGGSDTTSYKYWAAPDISTIVPVQGPLAAGTDVIITGTDFSPTGTTTVTFGANAATNVVVNAAGTQITCDAPAGVATGSVTVTVTSVGGSDTTSYKYWAAPDISTIAPVQGPLAAGTDITITGTDFSPTGTTTVTFGANAATNVVVNGAGTQITCDAPAGAATGSVTVTVTSVGGSDTTSYKYWAAPDISTIVPVQGPLAAGTDVIITGTDFSPAGTTTVEFGDGRFATGVVVNGAGTQITCDAPAGLAAGPVTVTVTSVGGEDATTYTYYGTPTITALDPNFGPEAGGNDVTITGTNFSSLASLSVTFGGQAATVKSRTSATEIVCTAPAGTGTVNVVVSAIGGTSGAAQYQYMKTPAVTGVNPAGGPLTNGPTVTITGQYFTGATGVMFGADAATNVDINVAGTQITCDPPDALADGTVDVIVTSGIGNSPVSDNAKYTYWEPPTITSIDPDQGPEAGGNSVDILGSNFSPGSQVTFGGVAVTDEDVNEAGTMITCTVPGPHAPVAVNVVVTSLGGPSAPSTYTYLPAPAVTGISPNTGPTTGTHQAIITGSNFTNVQSVWFGATEVPSVHYTVDNTGQITVSSVPAGAAGTVQVKVITEGGTSANTAADDYTYVVQRIYGVVYGEDLDAVFGPLAGATVKVTVGSDVVGTTTTNALGEYEIGDAVGLYGLALGTMIIVTADYPDSGGVEWDAVSQTGLYSSYEMEVSYHRYGGTLDYNLPTPTSWGDRRVKQNTGGPPLPPFSELLPSFAPVILSIAPTAGAQGSEIVITGTGFTEVTGVRFGTTLTSPVATAVTVVSPTEIRATVPTMTPGACTVQVLTSHGTSCNIALAPPSGSNPGYYKYNEARFTVQ